MCRGKLHIEKKQIEKYCAIVAEGMLVVLSLITCQLIQFNYSDLKKSCSSDDNNKKQHPILYLLKIVFIISGILINFAPVFFVVYAWKSPQVTVFNVSYLFNAEGIVNISIFDKIPSIVTNNMTNDQANSICDMENLASFGVFSKLVIAILTSSSFLSYFLFIYVLVYKYKCISLRNFKNKYFTNDPESESKSDNLDPFCIDDNDAELRKISTKLYFPESLFFIVLLLLNIVLWVACFGAFWNKIFNKPSYFTDLKLLVVQWEKVIFAMYMYSLLCTIVSCFIFAKIAYSVTHRCLKLYDEFKDHKDEGDVLISLIKKDDNFTKMGQITLNTFEFWFTVHWVCYTVTSFLSIVLFLEILKKNEQPAAGLENIPNTAIRFLDTELIVVGLFTLQHCFLFLYPCFKAAAVTVGREKLIKKVNAHPLNGHPLTLKKKQLYIQYLENKKFGFRISFFCARLQFGFNIAYVSIFIGLLSVLQKFSDLLEL